MTDQDRINNIEELKKNILADKNIDPDKQKDALRGLERTHTALSRTDEYYVTQRKIKKIESKMTTIFSLLFLITFFVSAWGIPNVIARSSDPIFYIAMIALVLWMTSSSIAPIIYKMQQKLYKPKSA
ncbi:MAG: hypothetical protein WC788_03535 [Candidatus Paceibacterota bacterium]|jgi:hypothetical protein